MRYQSLSMAQEFLRRRLQAGYGPQVVVPVDPDVVGLHDSATEALQNAAEKVAAQAGIPPQHVAARMFDNIFRLEPSDTLVLVVAVPERGVEMFVEIPAQLWRLASQDGPTGG